MVLKGGELAVGEFRLDRNRGRRYAREERTALKGDCFTILATKWCLRATTQLAEMLRGEGRDESVDR